MNEFINALISLISNVISSFLYLMLAFLNSFKDMSYALSSASFSQQIIILATIAMMLWFVGNFFISSVKSLFFIIFGIIAVLVSIIILNSLV